MDSITHLAQKLATERARQANHRASPIPNTAPPPYTPEEDDSSDADTDSDSDSDTEDSEDPIRLTINAATSLHGSNNLVSTSPTSPLSDATKFSALLLHAVNRINSAAAETKAPGRRMKLDLTINCGVTIVGDRNAVGHVGLRPKAPPAPAPGTLVQRVVEGERAAVVGAKRRAEESEDDEPRQKRRVISTADELDASPSQS